MAPPRTFPALDIRWPSASDPDEMFGRVLAAIDDARPTSAEETADGARVFFASAPDRDRAAEIFATSGQSPVARGLACTAIDVPDEQWAERSQASLGAIHVGRITVAPPWTDEARTPASGDRITIVIQPSMGFGTGHHASTRLCLLLMQRIDLSSARVVDLGTGSGVLAIAAARLGAMDVHAIDVDPDALVSATENVELNHASDVIALREIDLMRSPDAIAGRFDLVVANLTGAMLERAAQTLAGLVSPTGRAIVSGVELHEADDVQRALVAAGLAVGESVDADGWVALMLRRE